MHKGMVAVHYQGCEIRILPECHAAGGYAWSATSPKHDAVRINDSEQLYAALPFGAVSLEGKLATAGELNVQMTLVGRYEASRGVVRRDEFVGDCSSATHVVAATSVGAFRFFAGATSQVSASVSAAHVGAGGTSTHVDELLNEDGKEASCAESKDAPPLSCSAPVRLELLAIGEAKPCPPRTTWNGKKCESAAACPRGQFREAGSCIPNGVTYSLSPACEQPTDATACVAECDKGQAESCAEIGWRYMTGAGVAADPARAVELSRKACDAGSARGCNNLAGEYADGKGGVTKDLAKALSLYEKACDHANGMACRLAAVLVRTGSVTGTPDSAKAVELLKRSCELGNALACREYADDRRFGTGLPADPAETFRAYTRSCALGSPFGCVGLGLSLEKGIGVTKDEARAISFYRRGCDGGAPYGCTMVANQYMAGGAMLKDDAQALSLSTMACNGGDRWGCANLGFLLTEGLGVPKDEPRGVSLTRRACDDGVPFACSNLASWTAEASHGVARDDGLAFRLAEKECAHRADACALAGQLWEIGPRDVSGQGARDRALQEGVHVGSHAGVRGSESSRRSALIGHAAACMCSA